MLFLLKLVTFIIGHMPRSLLMPIGRSIGSLAFRLDKKRRGIALDNLKLAFKDKTDGETEKIAKKVFSNLGMMLFEFIRVPKLKRDGLDGYVEFTGLENIDAALSKGKGVILCTAHFGNWELFLISMALKGYPLDVVVREANNPFVEEYINWVRTSSGNRIIYKQRAMRKLLARLSENAIVTILIDQNATRKEGFFVDFFGAPACTNKGPALLALGSSAPVIPAFIIRTPRGHRVEVQEEVKLQNTGDREKDALENTRRCARVIEEMIRKHPEQWFWVHRRWKTRPDLRG